MTAILGLALQCLFQLGFVDKFAVDKSIPDPLFAVTCLSSALRLFCHVLSPAECWSFTLQLHSRILYNRGTLFY